MKRSFSEYAFMVRILSFLICSLFSLGSFSAIATAQEESELHAQISLYSDHSQAQPGQTIRIAIEQKIADGWHTYWKNPGDSGFATKVTWKENAASITLGALDWPAPHALPYMELTNYGYKDHAVLLTSATIPNTAQAGQTLTLTADVEWLACKEVCIPESGTYSLDLTIDNAVSTRSHEELFNTAAAQIPQHLESQAIYSFHNDQLILALPTTQLNNVQNADLFPYSYDIVTTAPQSSVSYSDDGKWAIMKRTVGDTSPQKEPQEFILSVSQNPAIHITAQFVENFDFSHPEQLFKIAGETPEKLVFGLVVFFAFLGGIILNLMPCVFPVLSIKAISLAKMKDKSLGHARLHGLAYTAGILLTFGIIAGVLISLRAAGETIGWGFQLQNPLVVLMLCWLLFTIGLNLSGLFEFGMILPKSLNGEEKSGAVGSFMAGILATLVATPCTAPFMGAALGYAITQPPLTSMTVFLALGLGLAFPYLILTFIPVLQRLMPRPGQWMVTLKHILAIPMYLSALWLVWVVKQQLGGIYGVAFAVAGMTVLAIGLWQFGKKKKKRILAAVVVLITALTMGGIIYAAHCACSGAPYESEQKNWQAYTPETLEHALKGDRPVFVNMTAAWCITCLANEKFALASDAVEQAFKDQNIAYLKGDWTNRSELITTYLEKFGRNGVPLYVFYGAPNSASKQRPDPVILPQILTPSIINRHIVP